VTIEVARPNETANTVEQQFFSVSDEDKRYALRDLVREREIGQAFVFCNSKLGCARLARALERDGFATNALHGDKSQDERLKALDAFKQGSVRLLVCTDVAARGLDIKDVPAVFNFDLPFNSEDYVHRIGRTGRAGASGLAISFVTPSDARLLTDIEKLTKQKAELKTWRAEARPVREESHRASRSTTSAPRRAPAPVKPVDPFFTQPYNADVPEGEAPAWEAPQPAVSATRSGNIRPKRKVAALFKTSDN
jgi:superfamily II DNA/RNA helicase